MSRPVLYGSSAPESGPDADLVPATDSPPVNEPTWGEQNPPRSTSDGVLPLYTPTRAAELLAVRESWLRRRAAERTVPCTFLGKHLRFSRADLVAIATDGARPPQPTHHTPGVSAGPTGRRRGRPRPSRPAQAPRPLTRRARTAERPR